MLQITAELAGNEGEDRTGGTERCGSMDRSGRADRSGEIWKTRHLCRAELPAQIGQDKADY